ncbi:MAG: NAD-dependent protein deacylase [Ruminococcaceae bacterium]|nr:NAD-dependent protein deacylase [Oscillospiraceae bacterium]
MNTENITKLAKIVENSKKIVFFGGAGVSTESGLKDYRSKDGIYNTYNKYGISPEEILSIDFFNENPKIFYQFYREFFLHNVKPNKAHIALAKLENSDKKVTVVTQNVDNLHQLAGSTNVLELHGTAEKYYCTNCGKSYTKEYIADKSKDIPYCTGCNDGIVRPVVTLYGEMLDDFVTERAIRAIWEADLLIIGGTSLTVYPAASFINYFNGPHLVVINKERTASDSRADLVFHDSIGEVLDAVCKKLEI